MPGLVLETNISGCGLEDCGLGMSTDQYEGHDDIPTLIHFHENARNSLLILILIKDCSIQHGLGLPTCTLAPISPTWAATHYKTLHLFHALLGYGALHPIERMQALTPHKISEIKY